MPSPVKKRAPKPLSAEQLAKVRKATTVRTSRPEPLTEIRICTELSVPEDRFVRAAIAAIEENPANAPIHEPPTGMGMEGRGALRMALVTEKRWKPGRKLRVRFLDGVAAVQAKVVKYAKQWEQFANLELEFVESGPAEIRISFKASGSWSYLGTDALVINANQPTMNYGWLTPSTSDTEYSRVVLHEFGHAFACIHEHSHPEAGIPWDEAMVIRYYRATNGWDEQTTRHNVLARYSASITNFSTYDPTSIMQYSVPEELTIGNFSIGWNTVLSDTDKQFIATMYPRAQAGVTQLKIGGALEASIGKHGEEDRYVFDVPARRGGSYVLETRGPTDVVMGLYGPNSETQLLATDDDSGIDYNARIQRALGPGRYYVRVRHYSSWGTGSYSIRLRKA